MTNIFYIVIALAQAESGMDHAAVGDRDRHGVYHARGAWQMHRDSWNDTCRALGQKWRWETDAHVPWKAEIIGRHYALWLTERYQNAVGRMPTPEDLTVMWTTGFEGYKDLQFDPTKAPLKSKRNVKRMFAWLAKHPFPLTHRVQPPSRARELVIRDKPSPGAREIRRKEVRTSRKGTRPLLPT